MNLIVPDIEPCILESRFPSPGRNEPCHCGSGQKYKRCCLPHDEEVWRVVAGYSRQADTVLELLRAMPMSVYEEYNP